MDAVAVMEMRINGGRPAPSSGWFVQERSTKPMKEVSAAVGSAWLVQERSTKPKKEVSAAVCSGNGYVNKAAGEALAAYKRAAEAFMTKPAGGKKRTKTVRVKQAYIDALLKRYPFEPFRGEASELEKNMPDPEKRELLRVLMAPVTAVVKALQDKEEAIVKQYLAHGYAEEEVEVDEEEEIEVDDEA